MPKYVVMALTHAGDKVEEWGDWCQEHVADMIRTPGFISAQAFRRCSAYSYMHHEVIATLPPYDFMTFYEVDEAGKDFLTTTDRPVGSRPASGATSFPTPLGGYTGNEYLWEAISPEFRALRDRPVSRTRYITVFTNIAGNPEEWPQWGADHVADMIASPSFCGTQALIARKDFSFAHKETLEVQPPYDLLTLYDLTDEGFEFMTTRSRPAGSPPEAGTRRFPSPLGQHVGDSFLWEAMTPQYRALR